MIGQKIWMAAAAWVLCVNLMLCANLHAAEPQQEQSILVLDVSGSMWGQIEGTAKIDIARKVVNEMVAQWDPRHKLGLVAYGHRREADCEDIETLIEPSVPDAGAIAQALNRVRPTGKTPLSAAVKHAAQALDFSAAKATVVLVSDGRETCGLDPCAVADELEAAGFDFTAHVIGFDISAESDKAQLQCLAERTGGKYFAAQDATSLAEAMNEVAQEVAVEKTLFIATMEKGGAPLTKGVVWTITEPEPDFEGRYTTITTTGAAQPRMKLAAGTYRVVAKRGAASVAKTVNIEDSTQQVEVVLGAGDLRLQAVLSEGSEPLSKGVVWTVYENTVAFDGARKIVTTTGAAQAKLALPAGEYLIEVRSGNATVSEVVQVQGGEALARTINLQAAQLRLEVQLDATSEVLTRGVVWTVTEPEPDFEGNYRQIMSTGAASPIVTLPAGQFRVIAKHGNATSTQVIELSPGAQVLKKFDLQAGQVLMQAVLKAGSEPLSRGVLWTVLAEGELKQINSTGAAQARFTLPTGQYVLRVKRGEAVAEQMVTVNPGQQQRIVVPLDAGEVNAIALLDGQEVAKGLVWRVLDAQGQLVKSTGAGKPSFTLSAGQYQLEVLRQRPQKLVGSTALAVIAGESTGVQVPLRAETL